MSDLTSGQARGAYPAGAYPFSSEEKVDPGDTAAFLNAAIASAKKLGADPIIVSPEVSAPVPSTLSASSYHDTGEFAAVMSPLSATQAAPAIPVAQPEPSQPVNPLVAARAAGIGPSEKSPSSVAPKPADRLYPMDEQGDKKAAAPGKSFDTSFGETKGRGKRALLIALVVVVVLAVAAAVAFFLMREKAQTEASASITEAADLISQADEVVLSLSEGLAQEFSTYSVSADVTDAMLVSTTVSGELTDAEAALDAASQSEILLSEEQRDAITAARSSISGRRALLSVGSSMQATDASITSATQSLQNAFSLIDSANTKWQSSLDTFSAYVADPESGVDLWACVDLDNDAANDIASAQAAVAQAKEAYPSGDYTGIETYLSARLYELQLLAQYDTLYAGGDTEGADAMLEEYTSASAAAGAAAGAMAWDAWSMVAGAYQQDVEAQRSDYDQATAACSQGDEGLASYLGAEAAPSLTSAAGE